MSEDELRKKIEALCVQGEAFLKEEKIEEALRVFEEVRGCCSNVPTIYVLIGNILMRMKKYQEAIRHLIHAQELFELGLNRSVSESLEEILKKAQKGFLAPLGLSIVDSGNPWRNPKICYSLAICWKNLGDVEKGLDFLNKAAKEIFKELDGSATPEGVSSESEVFVDGLGKKLNEVEVLEAAGIFTKAFDLLSSLVYEKIVANDEVERMVAGR